MANILATITLLKDIPNPKINGVKTGYIPHHKFNNIEYLISGLHDYGDNVLHFAGETLLAEIHFASWEFIKDQIKKDDEFYIREVKRIIGIGIVEDVFTG